MPLPLITGGFPKGFIALLRERKMGKRKVREQSNVYLISIKEMTVLRPVLLTKRLCPAEFCPSLVFTGCLM
jgi:hypothetical protein